MAASPNSKKEISEVLDKRLFSVRFGVFVLKSEKFEDKWIFDCLLWSHQIIALRWRAGVFMSFVPRIKIQEKHDVGVDTLLPM